MQPEYKESPSDFPRSRMGLWTKVQVFRSVLIFFTFPIFFVLGCRQPPDLVDPEPKQPYAGIKLKLAISEGIAQPALVRQFAQTWSERTGAQIEILNKSWSQQTEADLVILSSVDLPREVLAKSIIPLPTTYKSALHRYAWSDLTVSLTERIASWDAVAYALPIFHEGKVLLYRGDLWDEFAKATNRTGTQPETWEDLCEFVERNAKPFQPTYIPRPLSPDALQHEFHRIASNYDRRVIQESNLGKDNLNEKQQESFFSFDFSLASAAPRIDQASFVEAAKILKRLEACRPSNPQTFPFESILEEKAIAGVTGLDALYYANRPGSKLAGKLRIAPIPGSRFVYEGEKKIPLNQVNRVPYLGEGIWLGAVTPRCQHTEAAYDFFVDFAGSGTASLEWIASAKWGASGFRSSHFDNRNRNYWFGYGFDAATTDQLIEMQRIRLGITIANPTFALRLPNRNEFLDPLTEQLKKAIQPGGNVQEALSETARKWKSLQLDPLRYRISLGL